MIVRSEVIPGAGNASKMGIPTYNMKHGGDISPPGFYKVILNGMSAGAFVTERYAEIHVLDHKNPLMNPHDEFECMFEQLIPIPAEYRRMSISQYRSYCINVIMEK